jgi:hypothetical protein
LPYKLLHGDCLDMLRGLPDTCVDSVVTDPPAGISFMGREWDSDKGGRDEWIAWLASVMRECLRVLKPGGHALVWALPRTSHWTATAIEDAGFEVRDVVTHLFGTGFPKSACVSKAIDKAAGAERPVVGAGPYDSRRPRPTAETNTPGAEYGFGAGHSITAPATDAARQWEGWGTALKPASEHWILARKPLTGTVAANVQAHGVGGLNIDGCRIGTSKDVPASPRGAQDRIYGAYRAQTGAESGHDPNIGRWPANVTLSHTPDCGDACAEGCPVRLLDEQSGHTQSSARPRHNTAAAHNRTASMGSSSADWTTAGHADSGGASRFFYVAKPSRSERNAGTAEGNKHPTVKPIALMRWLCRIITPPGGTVLDPFAGSGTTLLAALAEGFHPIGIEREAEFVAIIRARVEHALRAEQPAQLALEAAP